MVSGECSKAHPAFKIARPFAVPSVLIALLNVTGLASTVCATRRRCSSSNCRTRRAPFGGRITAVRIDRQIERFLLARLFISVIVGVVVWIGFRLLRLPEAGIWSVVAAVLLPCRTSADCGDPWCGGRGFRAVWLARHGRCEGGVRADRRFEQLRRTAERVTVHGEADRYPHAEGRGAGCGTPHYGCGLLGLVRTVLLILWLAGNIGGGPVIR
jgi:hypothetical protein